MQGLPNKIEEQVEWERKRIVGQRKQFKKTIVNSEFTRLKKLAPIELARNRLSEFPIKWISIKVSNIHATANKDEIIAKLEREGYQVRTTKWNHITYWHIRDPTVEDKQKSICRII